MIRTLPLVSLAALTFAATASAQEDAVSYERTDLRGGIVMLNSGIAGNVAVLPGPDGIFVIDDQLPTTGSVLEAAIAEIAGPEAPRFILNTHWHGDHAGGNGHFAAHGTTIAAHHNVRARIIAAGEGWAAEPGAAPLLTFGDDLHFHMNGLTVEARHVPNAHTDGDSMVYFPEADVLHTGDILFSGLYPFIDQDSGGTVDGYIAALELALEIAGPETQIIAGHGPLSTEADIEASIAMLNAARALIAPLVAQGLSAQEVVDLDPLSALNETWSWRFITGERMARTLYRDIAGETD